MTHLERVLKSLGHEETDRIPLYINTSKWVISKLKKELGISTDSYLLKALNVDSLLHLEQGSDLDKARRKRNRARRKVVQISLL